jgi:hypothetical protein
MLRAHRFHRPVIAGPWFQDGTAATLPEAVRLMTRYQLGRRQHASEDISAIARFLRDGSGRAVQSRPQSVPR